MNDQLIHNKTYAHRLPPTLIEQARYWANFHEQGVFSDSSISGIGDSAFLILSLSLVHEPHCCSGWALASGRLNEGQPFISLFIQTEMIKSDPTSTGSSACDHNHARNCCHLEMLSSQRHLCDYRRAALWLTPG
ncbi:hypothetical protein BC827DRAFT_1176130, partial [Russula dissimulans]